MTERWRRELAGVDEFSPDIERLRRGAAHPPLSHARTEPPHRSRLVAGVTALVVFLLGVSLYVIPAVRGPNGEPSSAPSITAYPFFVPGAPRAAAVAEANKLVGLAHLPPGSQQRNHSPVRALNYPLGGSTCATDPCPYDIHRTTWWVIPLPKDEALSALRSHPPVGLSSEGDATTGSTGAVSWTYKAGPSPVHSIAELSLAVARVTPNKSALRVDGGLMWVPRRSAAERLPDDVETVRLASFKGNAVVARTTANSEAARQLAWLLNHIGRINMGSPSCPFDGKNATHYTMRFPTSARTYVFTEWLGCSPGEVVFVEVDGRTQPALAPALQVVGPGAAGVSLVGPIEPYLDCLLRQEADCKPWLGPDPPPTDPVAAFCGGLHLFNDWFSTDVAQANGDEAGLAAAVKGQLSGMNMWFTPNQQQIADPQIRSEAGRIVADALAMQTWTASSGRSFGSTLDTFNADSDVFVGRYCA